MENGPRRSEPVYYIGVAARLLNIHPQTLRMYERMGLIEPQRTGSNVRLYSEADIERLRRIQRLTQELGVNLAGVQIILDLLDKIDHQQDEIQRLKHELAHGPKQLPPPTTAMRMARRVQIKVS